MLNAAGGLKMALGALLIVAGMTTLTGGLLRSIAPAAIPNQRHPRFIGADRLIRPGFLADDASKAVHPWDCTGNIFGQ
jgi:hypothetical protein